MNVVDLIALCGLAESKSKARKLVEQGGVTVDGEKPAGVDFVVSADALKAGVVLKRGKKVFHKAVIK